MNPDARTGLEMSRRDFFGATAAATLAVSAVGAAAPQPIVDSHVHIWDRSKLTMPWLKGEPQLDYDAGWAEYRKAVGDNIIEKAVYLEVDVTPAQHPLEAKLAIELCRDPNNAFAGAVIGGRPADPGFAAYIEPLAKDPAVKGVRQVLHGSNPAGLCLQDDFVKGIRKLGELGLSFDLCMRHAELPDAAALVEKAPGTSFVLDHCGNPPLFEDLSTWKKDISRIAARPNVVAKVSGIIASAKGRTWKVDDLAPVVNHMIQAFGIDRVMFGGDWPVCTLGAPLAEWIAAAREITAKLSPEDRHKLFFANAVRAYRLA